MGYILPNVKISSPFCRFAGWGAIMGGTVGDLRFTVLNYDVVEYLCPVWILSYSGTKKHVSKEVLDKSGNTLIPR